MKAKCWLLTIFFCDTCHESSSTNFKSYGKPCQINIRLNLLILTHCVNRREVIPRFMLPLMLDKLFKLNFSLYMALIPPNQILMARHQWITLCKCNISSDFLYTTVLVSSICCGSILPLLLLQFGVFHILFNMSINVT